MSSHIPGYTYDIFISYRQKDNKGDKWVSEFVETLKTELESTFKEEISVYFDINPHDGLLETHDVDASLKEKLKCLIFVPIISRTYCDPNSFAWEHEFKVFIEQASHDKFGIKVKLSNGNVASRVLPVLIYDLDTTDIKLCESMLESALRGVEFIYKEPGVNRPLRSNEESPHDNLNHTIYRNQINKVSNAIKEVITGLEQKGQRPEMVSETVTKTKPAPMKKRNTTIIAGSIILLVLIILGLFIIPKMFGSKEQAEKSIAVLPFNSLSDDPHNQYLADGMMDAILTHLSKIKDLRVMSKTSVEQYRQPKETITEIGKELNVNYILEGSFQKFGDSIRLIVQLIRAGKEGHIWANIYDRHWNNVFSVQSEVAQKIASELSVALSPEEIEYMSDKPTENLEAYQAYLRGRYYVGQPHFTVEEWTLGLQGFQDAVELDTTFALAYGELARAHARLIYLRQDMSESRLEKADLAAAEALRLGSDQSGVQIAVGYYYLYAYRDENQALKHLEIAEKNFPNDVDILADKVNILIEKAAINVTKGQWEEDIHLLEQAMELSPQDVSIITDLAEAYWLTRRYKDAVDACNKAIAISPNGVWQYLFKSFAYMSWKGPCEESREALRPISEKNEWYLWSWYFQQTGEGNFQDALQLVDTMKVWGVNNKMWAIPRASLTASIYDFMNEPELGREDYKTAVAELEKMVANYSNDPRYHSALGIAYAGLGKKDEAINEGLKAVELLPVSKDALYGLGELQDLAIIYTMVGEYELALDQLEKLLSLPSWVSPAWLNSHIQFAPLKSHSGYKELITKYATD